MTIIQSPLSDKPIPICSISDFLCRPDLHTPVDRPALVDAETRHQLSYPQYVDLVAKVRSRLLARPGFCKWDVVAIYSRNSIWFPVVSMGVLQAGGTVTPVSPNYTHSELRGQLADSGAKLLFTTRELLPVALEAIQGLDAIAVQDIVLMDGLGAIDTSGPASLHDWLNDSDGSVAAVKSGPSFSEEELKTRPAILCYSSGTTGRSKGVMTSHFNIVADIVMNMATEETDSSETPDRIWVAPLPMCHIFGMHNIHMSMALGATLVVLPRYELHAFCRTLQDFKATRAYVVPPIILGFLRNPGIAAQYDLGSVRLFRSGGSSIGRETVKQFRSTFQIGLSQGFGMTELSPASIIVPDGNNPVYDGTIGILLPNQQARIVDPDSGRDLDRWETGELLIRGPNVMVGYHRRPEETQNTITTDRWLRTGDLVRRDDHGNFCIVDRIKELIKYKGFQVAPAELEAVLLTHAYVADAVVVGIPDRNAGELPKAFVVLKNRSSVHGMPLNAATVCETIRAFVDSQVAVHKRLRGGVAIISQVPRAPSGKILRRVVRGWIAEGPRSKL
ncbi:uncharacterized protein BJ171DRAFT_440098 [Polychytrium aggregatum]|uniref:uncharacterized protein n=1 Tax=Polychytrium aggregatum TaxID=110093 RepID=UPI0022FF05F5|nr:uncharacterized protein BJ171DRAFT_440098 [Polychytrium aggregatum]KAI9206605.1 hypothetical protein BJ171DRAFT_440098 [Polychytrium aggregatum]